MKIIKELSEMIEDELEGAEEYAKNAIYYKEENPALAKTFYEISTEEMRHVDMLHGEVVALIEKHKREHGDPPAAMQAVYDFLHKRNIEWAAEIRRYQNEYRG
jgi:bacterioferritin (cytochrome b1)